MFRIFRKRKPAPAPQKPVSAFTTGVLAALAGRDAPAWDGVWEQPELEGVATDSSIDGTVPAFKGAFNWGIPEAQASWYASQSFIGYSMCALIAKQWLVDKACSMPARDALRQGYRIDGDDKDLIQRLAELNKDRGLNATLKDFITTGRRFGGAAALFVVDSTDPQYYEKPFNLDGVQRGMYKGISIIEPSWMMPDLTADNVQDPASLNFYDPQFWIIGNRRYHKSHFQFYVPYPVARLARHHYRYFGVSVPERIYERVYAAERTANEAPQLAMTKRLLTMGIPDFASADKEVIAENMAYFSQVRDNYGVNISDDGTVFNQFDTALADLDVTIMTQYQLVAAAAGVPGTKLMGTTPKGFNSTGEYEEASYREELESLQTNDMEPLMDRHHDLLLRSLGLKDTDLSVVWNPLDSPTAKEYAEINMIKSQAALNWANAGAVDGADIRTQIVQDRDSDFYGIDDADTARGPEGDFDIMRYLDDDEDDGAASPVGAGASGDRGGQAAALPRARFPRV